MLMAANGATFSPEGLDSDAEVMLRAKAGDQSAFDYLVQKYRRPMISFMYRMARNSAAAEDLAQEVFLTGLSLAPDLRGECEIYDLALSNCDQPGREPCARYAARAA